MKHIKIVSRTPGKAQMPVDIQFIIDILNAVILKKGGSPVS